MKFALDGLMAALGRTQIHIQAKDQLEPPLTEAFATLIRTKEDEDGPKKNAEDQRDELLLGSILLPTFVPPRMAEESAPPMPGGELGIPRPPDAFQGRSLSDMPTQPISVSAARETFVLPVSSAPPRAASSTAIQLTPMAETVIAETGDVSQRLTFALTPERLGRVEISIAVSAGRTIVHVAAVTPAGFAALNADREALLPILRELRPAEVELRIVLQCEPTVFAPPSETTHQSRLQDRPAERTLEGRSDRHERDETPERRRERSGPRDRRHGRGDTL